MPELPEVNAFRTYFDGTSLNQKIVDISISDGMIIKKITDDVFAAKLSGRYFKSSYRRGKYLFAELDNASFVLFHFGMTGDFKYYFEDEDRPKHERFHILFENGAKLGFDCPRKFARIEYIPDLDKYIDNLGLGIEALKITLDEFLAVISGRSAAIKGVLLNQKLIAGIGNLYADEICYQTRIHPASRLNAIPKKKLKEIFLSIQSILSEAIERTANYKDYPDDWFWKWRVKDGESEKGKIMVEKVAGRTTYYVKGYQKKYG